MEIDSNTIEVIDADNYHIVGAIGEERRLSWDLKYTRKTASWFGRDREPVGTLPWELMSWLVYMPGAVVSGVVEIDGQVCHLGNNVRGYHDHNWGEWLPFDVLWNWAQLYVPGLLAFELGDIRHHPSGVATIDLHGNRTNFSKGQYKLVHTRWELDEVNKIHYPIRSWLFAKSEEKFLVIRMNARATQPLPGGPPGHPLIPVIYEQTAHYRGWLWNFSGINWVLESSFKGDGFREYNALTWTK